MEETRREGENRMRKITVCGKVETNGNKEREDRKRKRKGRMRIVVLFIKPSMK